MRIAVLAALAILVSGAASSVQADDFFYFHYDSQCIDEVCDFIGQGNSATWTDAEGTWNARRNFDNGASLSFDEADPGFSNWHVDLSAPDEAELSVGSYPVAERFPFQGPGIAGLSVTGEGRGCNTLTGSFNVSEVRFDRFGEPVRLNASFVQHCGGATPALTGNVSFAKGTLGPVVLGTGNVLVAMEERLFEYTRAGVLVTEIPVMESTGTVPDISEHLRDVIVDPAGRVHIFNGTFSPVLSSFETGTGAWQHNAFTDWAIANNGSYGSAVAFGDYVYVTDGLTGDDGIVRFDTSNGYSAERTVGPTGVFDYQDLAIGYDGLLYALQSNEDDVDIFDPTSMTLLGQITLAHDVRGIAVNARGQIFGASWDGNLYRFDSMGNMEASHNPDVVGNLSDIDLARDGTIVAAGGFDEDVVVTDESLASSTTFPVGNGFDGPFVALVQPPPALLFTNGDFESGGFGSWSSVNGELGGFLEVNADAAGGGSSFGMEVVVGSACPFPDDVTVESPPVIQGDFIACDSVLGQGVTVDPNARFGASSSVAFGNGFAVATNATLEAILDSTLQSGFGFVEDGTPDRSEAYNAQFSLNLDSLTLADGDLLEHLRGSDSGGTTHFRVFLKRNVALSENRLYVEARLDDGSTVQTAGAEEVLLPSGWLDIRVSWRAGAGTGHLLVWLNGALQGGLQDLDNGQASIDSVLWGAVGGSVGSSTGALKVDDYSSWN